MRFSTKSHSVRNAARAVAPADLPAQVVIAPAPVLGDQTTTCVDISLDRQRLLVKSGLLDEPTMECGQPRDVGPFECRTDQIGDRAISVHPDAELSGPAGKCQFRVTLDEDAGVQAGCGDGTREYAPRR